MLAIGAVGASAVAAVPATALPVGVGPVPITFNLNDSNGNWFDSGLELFGGKSLAVAELPRLGTTALDGGIIPKLPDLGLGLGGLAPQESGGLMNLNLVDSLTGLVKDATKSAPLLGETGVNLGEMLNLDSTLSAVKSIAGAKPEAAAAAGKAEGLLGQFSSVMAGLPADAPISLNSLPVGLDLQKALDDLATFAVKGPAVTANFKIEDPASESLHDITSLIWPENAPYFEQMGAFAGEDSTQLTEPGLYAWTCTIHPYMLGATVVDDPLTIGLDFGKSLKVNSRNMTVPSSADVIQQLVRSFFTITVPDNWQKYSATESSSWNPLFPPAPILQYDENGNPLLIPILDAYYDKKFNYPKTLDALTPPKTPGVGEVWIDTQMEEYAGKDYVGAATKVNVENWKVDRKISGSSINLNNPHNMWTDKDYKYLYQTQWFDDELSVFDRDTGAHVRTVEVGPDPSHVMTRTDTDQVQVAINGGTDVVELSPGATKIDRRIPVGPMGANMAPQHPHAFWLSGDGKTTITPNVNPYDASVVDNETGTWKKEPTGELPIASGMMSDQSKFYMADFLGASISCVSLAEDACMQDGKAVHNSSINLWENYDPVAGRDGTKPWGGLTIQLPVSPDDKALLAANTFSGTVSVIDPKTDKVLKELPCNAGCHGINFGAKKGGGYYGYVSNKFSNAAQVIDIDPNGDGNISDAAIAGQLVLNQTADTKMEDTLTGQSGMGGQGVLPIPLVYNGWSQQVPAGWREKLTPEQLNPIG
ncbi:multicopper oxidase [Amycolatopsis nigrescens]|uniref:multicopper oxidase n=1 Tax=Amycolatopsis nigrescens TaxID=381445 RepID=UPI000381BEE7|nr:multicopper oxidase [Amycolatopsis nigrescens]